MTAPPSRDVPPPLEPVATKKSVNVAIAVSLLAALFSLLMLWAAVVAPGDVVVSPLAPGATPTSVEYSAAQLEEVRRSNDRILNTLWGTLAAIVTIAVVLVGANVLTSGRAATRELEHIERRTDFALTTTVRAYEVRLVAVESGLAALTTTQIPQVEEQVAKQREDIASIRKVMDDLERARAMNQYLLADELWLLRLDVGLVPGRQAWRMIYNLLNSAITAEQKSQYAATPDALRRVLPVLDALETQQDTPREIQLVQRLLRTYIADHHGNLPGDAQGAFDEVERRLQDRLKLLWPDDEDPASWPS